MRHTFTMIELVVVLAVVALLLGIAAPNLRRFARGRDLVEESRRFLAVSRRTASEAVSQGVPVELWIDPTDQTYGLQAVAPELPSTCELRRYAVPDSVEITVQTDTAAFSDEACRVRWYPDGGFEMPESEVVAIRFTDTGRPESRVCIVPDEWRTEWRVESDEEGRR